MADFLRSAVLVVLGGQLLGLELLVSGLAFESVGTLLGEEDAFSVLFQVDLVVAEVELFLLRLSCTGVLRWSR